MFASGFSVVSKNALLCGGSNEIAFDGENVLHVMILSASFCDRSVTVKVNTLM